MRHSSIVLLSGGLDSLASLHWAKENTDLLFGLTFDYGQRAVKNEMEAAAKICRHYDIKHLSVSLPWYSSLKSTALTDAALKLPEPKKEELNDPLWTHASAKAVWIPNRNGVFINIAGAFAESTLAELLVVGFNREEAATFPDNSEEFVKAGNEFLKFSTNGKVSLMAPMADKNKTEIVKWFLAEKGDLSRVWSCYSGGEKMCGACESCARLKRALETAGAQSWQKKIF